VYPSAPPGAQNAPGWTPWTYGSRVVGAGFGGGGGGGTRLVVVWVAGGGGGGGWRSLVAGTASGVDDPVGVPLGDGDAPGVSDGDATVAVVAGVVTGARSAFGE
jgi:hypothetical protein